MINSWKLRKLLEKIWFMNHDKSDFFHIRICLRKGSDRIDSFWIAEVNQKSRIDFDSRGVSESFFWFLIHLSESFHFWFWFILIRRSESKITKRFWFVRCSKTFWFTWANHFIFDSYAFWFTFKAKKAHWFILIQFDFPYWFDLIHNSFWFLFILICDSNLFYLFWFGSILIRRESRFTRESWFTCESKSNRIKNQR